VNVPPECRNAEVQHERDEAPVMDRVPTHGEEVGATGAVGRPEGGHGTAADFPDTAREIVFAGVTCPKGKGDAGIGPIPQVIDVPEELFSFPQVSLDPPGQVSHGGACVAVISPGECQRPQASDDDCFVPGEMEYENVTSAVVHLAFYDRPGYGHVGDGGSECQVFRPLDAHGRNEDILFHRKERPGEGEVRVIIGDEVTGVGRVHEKNDAAAPAVA